MNRARLRRAQLGALSLSLGTAALVAPALGLAPAQAAASAPNVVLIVADDLGYDQTSLYGRPGAIDTPNLAALGDAGVRITDGYVASPVCSPSRSAIMTGLEPARVGADSNWLTRARPERMPTNTFVDNLPSQYTTMAVGKWDLAGGSAPFDTAHLPNNMGFDNFYGFLNGEHDYCPPAPGTTNLRQFNPTTGNYDNVASSGYLTDDLTNHAVDYINNHAANSGTTPFFLYLAYNAPHTPLETPTTCGGGTQSDSDMFHDMVTIMDNGIGQVRQAIAADGIADNTMVIFISDNGQQSYYYTGSTRGGKYTLFEGGVKVPFAMTWPAGLPAGTTYDQTASSLDLYSTILAAAGGDPTPPPGSSGVNLLPYLNGQNTGVPNPNLSWRYVVDLTGINPEGTVIVAQKDGDEKWIRSTTPPESGVPPTIRFYLFDLATNPNETDSGNQWPNPTLSNPLLSDFQAWNELNPATESFNNARTGTDPRANEPDGYIESGGTWTVVPAGTDHSYKGTSAGFAGRSMLEGSSYGDAKTNSTLQLNTAGSAGVIVRGTSAGDVFNGYIALIAIPRDGSACAGAAPQPGGGSPRVILTKVTNGTGVQVACQDMALSLNTDYKLTVTAVGNTLTVSVGSTQELNWTDTSGQAFTFGRAGLRVLGVTPSQNAQALFATLNASACTGTCP